MTDFAVICRTCLVNIWQGDKLVEQDGQTLLTAYADSIAGTVCPSKVDPCPHKTAAVAGAKQRTLAAILTRLAAVEAKVRP